MQATDTHPSVGVCFSVVRSRFFLNAEFSGSGSVLPHPTGSAEESKPSREAMYKGKAGTFYIIQLGLLHPVYSRPKTGKNTQRMLMLV